MKTKKKLEVTFTIDLEVEDDMTPSEVDDLIIDKLETLGLAGRGKFRDRELVDYKFE